MLPRGGRWDVHGGGKCRMISLSVLRGTSVGNVGRVYIMGMRWRTIQFTVQCKGICWVTFRNMKLIIALSALVAVAVSAPQGGSDKDAVIVKYESDNIGIDGYNYLYETSNGIQAQETGQVNNAGSENEAVAVRGSYSWTGPDGVTYTITYIADDNGFQPQGAHLPQAP